MRERKARKPEIAERVVRVVQVELRFVGVRTGLGRVSKVQKPSIRIVAGRRAGHWWLDLAVCTSFCRNTLVGWSHLLHGGARYMLDGFLALLFLSNPAISMSEMWRVVQRYVV